MKGFGAVAVCCGSVWAWTLTADVPLRAQARASQATPAADTIYQDVYNGWKWWHVYCYRCHGVDAMGTTTAPNLIDPN